MMKVLYCCDCYSVWEPSGKKNGRVGKGSLEMVLRDE